ncbi:MAG: membrane dipeptidase [Thermomicrobiales bacterium]
MTERGKALLEEMNETNLLDITHLNDQSFWEAVEIFTGPIWASHSNCRALFGDRQLTDQMLQHIIERRGHRLRARRLDGGAELDSGRKHPEICSMEDYVDHIDHICQVGRQCESSRRHWNRPDGGYGTEQTPRDLDTIYESFLSSYPWPAPRPRLRRRHRKDHAR